MHDQSFCEDSLEKVFEKRDFYGVATVNQAAFKAALLTASETSAAARFRSPGHPLASFPLKGKTVFHFPRLSDELVGRKLCENIKRAKKITVKSRAEIVTNLKLLLEEGVPYRIYRLDVKSFYESFSSVHIKAVIGELSLLSPHSKILLDELLACHAVLGGTGVPRGLSLSAALSNLLMHKFDNSLVNLDDVFFYARYVDDIIIVSSGREDAAGFLRKIEKLLPAGMTLNPSKKEIVEAPNKVTPTKKGVALVSLFQFSYLDYQFIVGEPARDPKIRETEHFRSVTVDIAASKIERFKTRISRSFHAFSKDSNWHLLRDRLRFLTTNFSVYNPKVGGKKLAGIYHSYPLLSDDAAGLKNLDFFLKHAILSRTGRIGKLSSPLLNGSKKRELLGLSFENGHRKKTFIHFSGPRIKEIQQCWIN